MANTWALLFIYDSDIDGLYYITNSDSSIQTLNRYDYSPNDTYELTGYSDITPQDNDKTAGFTRARTAGRWFNLRAKLSDFYDSTADSKTGIGWVVPYYYIEGEIIQTTETDVATGVQTAVNKILGDANRVAATRGGDVVTASDGTQYLAFANNIYTTNNGTSETTIAQTMLFDCRSSSIRKANGISKAASLETVTLTKYLNNCTSTDAPDTLTSSTAYSFTVTANDGYEFNTAPTLTYYGGSVVQAMTQTATVSDDKLTATFSFTTPSSITTPCNLRATADAITETSNAFGIVNLYKMTVANLRTLAASRYYMVSTDYYYSAIDLGDFITSLRRFFINVPSTRETVVKLYDKTITGLTVGVVETVAQHTTSNAVTVPELFNNNADYENTEIEIFLPFHGLETLDASQVVGKSVIVDYTTDLFNGDTVITITADDTIIATYNCNVSQEIPYILTSINDAQVKQAVEANAAALNNYSMFIVVRTPKTATADTVNPTGKTGVIGDFSGFNTFKNIKLSTLATQAETDDIISKLESGVII